jgi:CheY-like chemotaxis protein
MERKRILLVDDSGVALMTEEMILRRAGRYDLTLAHDGVEAVETATAELPDLILMDVVMPRMTGVEACKKLRSQDKTKDIPIILVTTRGEPSSIEIGYESGCNDYVTKPINSMELLGKVENLIG